MAISHFIITSQKFHCIIGENHDFQLLDAFDARRDSIEKARTVRVKSWIVANWFVKHGWTTRRAMEIGKMWP